MASKNYLISFLLLLIAISAYSQNLTISGSNSHSVMICANGNIYAWGKNNLGQLGVDMSGTPYTLPSSDTPLRIGVIGEIFQVDAGSGAHTLAMTCDGMVYAWGLNTHGQLGNTTITNQSNGADKYCPYPTLVQAGETNPSDPTANLENVTFVSGGNTTSMAIWEDANGETFAITWGENAHQEVGAPDGDGQLYYIAGDGSTDALKTRPVFVKNGEQFGNPPLENVIAIEAGDATAIALTNDGYVWSWGSNQNNALGRVGDHTMAMRVTTATGYLNNIVSITAGDRHMLALDANGNVWAWGGDWGSGQIGDGNGYFTQTYAVKVIAGAAGNVGEFLGDSDPVVSIAAGQAHSIASTESGRVYTWGANGFFLTSNPAHAGQLGVGDKIVDKTDSDGFNNKPNLGLTGAFTPLENVVAVSDGDAWTFAITESGEIYMAGWNKEGQLGLGNTTNQTYFTLMTTQPCTLTVPCPKIKLGPDLFECEDFTYNLNAGLIYPGFIVNYYYEGALIYEDSVKLSEDPKELNYNVSKFGTYKVEIVDERPETHRPCNKCAIVSDEITITKYEAPFEDPGVLDVANKIIFCGLVNDAYVEKLPWNTYDGKYEWYGTNTSTKVLATSIDEEIIDTPLDTLDLERHEDYVAGDPNSNDSVFYAYVKDISSFLATAGEGNIGFCATQTYSDSKQYVLVTVYTPAKLSELSFMQLDPYGSNSADFEVVVYNYSSADATGQSLSSPIYSSGKTSFKAVQSSAISRTIDGLDFELDGTASGKQYWIGVEASSAQIALYTCGGNYPYEDDNTDYGVFTIDKRNGYNEANNMSAITNIGLQVGSQYPCERVKVALTRRCPPCTKPQIQGLQFAAGADENICPGQSVTIEPDVTTSNMNQEHVAWVMYQSAIADTLSTNRILKDSVDLTKAEHTVQYADAGFYTLHLYDNWNPDDQSCWETFEIEVVAPDPPEYEFSNPVEICSGETAQDVTITFTGEAPFNFVVEDQNGNTYSTSQINQNTYSIDPLPTAVGSYDFVLTSLSDANCDGEVLSSKSVNLTVHAIPEITLADPADLCEYANPYNASTGLAVAPSTITGTGVFSTSASSSSINSSTGIFDPKIAGAGTWDITYTYTADAAYGSCSSDETVSITVQEKPDVFFNLPADICGYDTPVDLIGNENTTTVAKTEIWSVSPQTGGVPNVSGAQFDPSEGSDGTTYTITYEYESSAGCLDTAEMEITVHKIEQPVTKGTSVNIQAIQINGATALDEMSAIGRDGASFRWYYNGTDVFDDGSPSGGESLYRSQEYIGTADSIGDFDYEVTQTIFGCTSDPATVRTTITDCPTPAPPVENTFMCVGGTDIPQFEATAAGHGDLHWLDADGIEVKSGPETTYAPPISVNNAGVFEFSVYEHNDTEKCDGPSSKVTITVRDNPDVSISLSDVTYCWNDDEIVFDVQPRKGGSLDPDNDDVEQLLGDATLGSSGVTFDPAFNGEITNTYTIQYLYTDIRDEQNNLACIDSASIDITVTYVPPVEQIDDYKLNTSEELEIGAKNYTGVLAWEKDGAEITEAANEALWKPTDKYVPKSGGLWELGDHIFQVTQEIDGCVSDPTDVTVKIIDCPTKAPIPKDLAYCVDETGAPSVRAEANNGIDANIHWFLDKSDIEPGSIPLDKGPSYAPDNISTALDDVGEYTFYVSEWDPTEQCYGPSSKVVMTVHKPVDVTVSLPEKICHGTTADIETTPQYNSQKDILDSDAPLSGNIFTTKTLPEVTQSYSVTYTYKHTYVSTGKECTYEDSTSTEVVFVEPPFTQDAYLQQDTPTYDPAPPVVAELAGADCIEWTTKTDLLLNDTDCDEFYFSPDTTEGTYAFNATRVIGECKSDPALVQLQITYCPVGKVALMDDIVCDDVTSYTFSGTLAPNSTWGGGKTPDGDEEIYWSTQANNVSLSSSSGPDLTVPVTGSKVIRYASLYDPDYTCFGVAQRVELTVKSIDPPSLNVSPICQFNETGVELSTASNLRAVNSNARITWYLDQALLNTLGTGNTIQAPDTDAGIHTYYATATNDFPLYNGNSATCTSDPASVNYEIYQNPEKPYVIGGIACQESGKALMMKATSTSEVHWYKPVTGEDDKEMATNGTNLPLSETTQLVVGDNIYYAKVKDITTGCWSDSSQAVFTLKEKPEVPILSGELKAICYGLDEIQPIEAVPFPGSDVYWYVNGSATEHTIGNTLQLEQDEVAPGNIIIKVIGDLDGCLSDPDSVILPVKEVPNAEFAMDTIVCQYTKQVTIQPKYPDQENVTFSIEDLRVGLNPVTISGTDYPIFLYKPNVVGKDTVIMTASNGFCSTTNVQPFYIVPRPRVELGKDLFYGTGTALFYNYTEQDTVANLLPPGIEFWMLFGEGIEQDTVFVEAEDFPFEKHYEYGNYVATLYAVDTFGCKASDSVHFRMEITKGLYMPNAFAPSAKASYEVKTFLPKGYNLEKYQLYIYDSWGNMIFYTDEINPEDGSPQKGWDGRDMDGNLMKSDYYIWKVEATFKDHKNWDGMKDKFGKYKTFGTVFLIE